MNFFCMLLITTAWTSALVSSATLRGAGTGAEAGAGDAALVPTSLHHRRLREGTTCGLFQADIEHGPNPMYSEEKWLCKLPQEESSRLGGLEYVEIYNSRKIIHNATSGRSAMTVGTAFIDPGNLNMYIPEDTQVEIHDLDTSQYEREQFRRSVAESTGVLTTLVIRVIDSKGVAPDASIETLEDDVFDSEVCLKSQMEACSYGKLQIESFKGQTETKVTVKNGVVDIHMDYDMSTDTDDDTKRRAVQTKSLEAALEQLGELEEDKYGLVMFCMPPGINDWLAHAWTNHRFSFYNNNWCSSVSAQLHEIGHNLGLAHSGEKRIYDDKIGMMGMSYDNKNGPRMCFNSVKSFQLRWYEDKVRTIDPLSKPSQRFTMNGVADYLKNPEALISLRLEQKAIGQDYYIGFNRRDGINEGTIMDWDMVTIHRKQNGPYEVGTSEKVAKLALGQGYTIRSFDGERDVRIEFIGRNEGDATIEIIDIDNGPINEPVDPDIPCEEHTIQFKTDNYPTDNLWYISMRDAIGSAVEVSPKYADPLTTYTHKVCLKHGGKYNFYIHDLYGDGVCCGQGSGFYKVIDSKGKELISSGTEQFKTKIIAFEVDEAPGSLPTKAPVPTPTNEPTQAPVPAPTKEPTQAPVPATTKEPTKAPVPAPTKEPTKAPVPAPTKEPTKAPVPAPTKEPTKAPVPAPTKEPTKAPVPAPTKEPTKAPVPAPTKEPTQAPVPAPTKEPTKAPVPAPTKESTKAPVPAPTQAPVPAPTKPPKENKKCKDRRGKFRVRKQWGRQNCKWYAKNNKCDEKKGRKKPIWQFCKKACGKC